VSKRCERGLVTDSPRSFNERVNKPRAIIVRGEIYQVGATLEFGMHGALI
jgi:hypothetical protein